MTYRRWHVNQHVVELEHGWWSGSARLQVDGNTEFERPSPPLYLDFGFAHRFDIDGHPCAIRVVGEVLKFRHELFVGEDATEIEEARELPLDHRPDQMGIFVGTLMLMILLACCFCTS